MNARNSAISATESDIRITWDSEPIRQLFGEGRVVLDGVAETPDGKRYRINASANRFGRRADIGLRYLSDAKRGHEVPEGRLQLIRSAAQESALRIFAAFILAERNGNDRATLAELETIAAESERRDAMTPVDCARRDAESERQRCTAPDAGRSAFDPAKPFRVYNRTPNFSACFDFATLLEARAYLAAQLARRDYVTGGAAPVGPKSNSLDPFRSFIIWPDGTETLADSPWNYTAPGFGQDWEAPAMPESIKVERAGDGYAVETVTDGAAHDRRTFMQYENAEQEARGRAAIYRVDVFDYAAKAPAPVETIDMTPTWAESVTMFLALIENGTAEGRAFAIGELQRMAKALDSARKSDVMAEYPLRSDGCQAAGAIVLRKLADNDATPFVVHFRNDADSERMGRPVYYFGDYCANLSEAWQAFGEKVRRYDPAGRLLAS